MSEGAHTPDNSGLNASAVAGQGGLHLGRAHAVPADVDDVIHAPHQPVVAVAVAPRPVACEVVTLRNASSRDPAVIWHHRGIHPQFMSMAQSRLCMPWSRTLVK